MSSSDDIITRERTTKETEIHASLSFKTGDLDINTNVPFLNHMLHAFLFHGSWSGSIQGTGDVDVDAHHLVEDMGIVLGSIIAEHAFKKQPLQRFGHAVIPMDDALASSTVDFSNRPYLHYDVSFPQTHVGSFDTALCREFFSSLANNARINLHILCLHGLNSRHMAEAMFKASAKAIFQGLQTNPHYKVPSTKGSL